MKVNENEQETAEEDSEEPKFKIKKEVSATNSLYCEFTPVSAQPHPNEQESPPPVIKSKKKDLWENFENAGAIKDLLPSGIIKNSSKLRFDIKEISLTEEV